jgi:valyl-tRNA synthetase
VETLVTKVTSNMMNPRQAEKVAQRTRRQYPKVFLPTAPTRSASPFASLATFNRTLNFDLEALRGLPAISATRCGTRPASC